MKRYPIFAVAIAAAIPVLACAQSTSPYSGQETRAIKTLSPDEVKAYLDGEGLGMAKAGELNHYPGPKHVLDMANQLALGEDQKQRITVISDAMTAAAVPLGREIVDAERALDTAFATGTIDDAGLRARTRTIGELQGRLRDVHLAAHLATRKVLSTDQIAMYDRLRGYGSPAGDVMHHHDM